MSLSDIVVKLIGAVLALVGFALLLDLVGLHLFGVRIANPILEVVVGVIFLGGGIYIVRGGNITI